MIPLSDFLNPPFLLFLLLVMPTASTSTARIMVSEAAANPSATIKVTAGKQLSQCTQTLQGSHGHGINFQLPQYSMLLHPKLRAEVEFKIMSVKWKKNIYSISVRIKRDSWAVMQDWSPSRL